MYTYTVYVCLYLVDATLQFEQKTYIVNKSNEAVTPVLILSNPLSTSVTIEVFSIKSSAYGMHLTIL